MKKIDALMILIVLALAVMSWAIGDDVISAVICIISAVVVWLHLFGRHQDEIFELMAKHYAATQNKRLPISGVNAKYVKVRAYINLIISAKNNPEALQAVIATMERDLVGETIQRR